MRINVTNLKTFEAFTKKTGAQKKIGYARGYFEFVR